MRRGWISIPSLCVRGTRAPAPAPTGPGWPESGLTAPEATTSATSAMQGTPLDAARGPSGEPTPSITAGHSLELQLLPIS